jgi:tetratricopeptide (TPR) repeat protein
MRVGESLVGIPQNEIRRIQAERPLISKALLVSISLLLVLGFAASRLIRRSVPPPVDRESLVLGDIESPAGEEYLGEMVKQAVATKLFESPFLALLPEKQIQNALQEMTLHPDQKLTQTVTNEICAREGMDAALTGSVGVLGSHYVVGLRVADCRTGEPVALEQAEADDREHLIAVVGNAVAQLRRKLGESLHSGGAFDMPLESATTRSFDAWRYFTEGNKDLMEDDNDGAIRFFELAVQKDPEFALAFAKLAQAYDNLEENANAVTYAEEAFKLRENVTEHEKFYITARYYDIVTGEVEKEIETLKDWKQSFPKDWMPRYDLADSYSGSFGRFDDAIEELREAIPLNPKDPDVYSSLAESLIGKGDLQESLKGIDSANAKGLNSTRLRIARFEIGLLQGNAAPTLTTSTWPKDEADREAVLTQEAWVAVLSGRLAIARRKIHVVAAGLANRGFKEAAGGVESDMAVVEAEYGDFPKAGEDINSALAFAQKNNVLINAALVFSLTSQDRRANVVIAKLQTRFPEDTLINNVWIPVARARQEIAKGRAKHSLELLEPSRPYELGQSAEFLPIDCRGTAYLSEKDGTNAAAEFQRIIEHRGVSPTSELYPLALLGLARAANMAGDGARSRNYYEQLLNQWKDADPDIPLLRQAKNEYVRLQEASRASKGK